MCFLPNMRCLRRPSHFMWKFICQTNNTEIVPQTFRRGDMTILPEDHSERPGVILEKLKTNDNVNKDKQPFPTIVQPLFGRYDFRILPSFGYYDVIFNYKLDDQEDKNHTTTISSQFILSK